MATDPNFNLRTHERLFTGKNKIQDEGLRQAAVAAVPKCKQCGAWVVFQGNTPKHYDARWDMDVKGMDLREGQKIQQSGGELDTDHKAVAEVPKSGAPAMPVRAAEVDNRPQRNAADTRRMNRTGEAQQANRALSRQFSPDAFDENGIMKPGIEYN